MLLDIFLYSRQCLNTPYHKWLHWTHLEPFITLLNTPWPPLTILCHTFQHPDIFCVCLKWTGIDLCSWGHLSGTFPFYHILQPCFGFLFMLLAFMWSECWVCTFKHFIFWPCIKRIVTLFSQTTTNTKTIDKHYSAKQIYSLPNLVHLYKC